MSDRPAAARPTPHAPACVHPGCAARAAMSVSPEGYRWEHCPDHQPDEERPVRRIGTPPPVRDGPVRRGRAWVPHRVDPPHRLRSGAAAGSPREQESAADAGPFVRCWAGPRRGWRLPAAWEPTLRLLELAAWGGGLVGVAVAVAHGTTWIVEFWRGVLR